MANSESTPAAAPTQSSFSFDSNQISAQESGIRRLTVSYGAGTVREPDGRSRSAPMLRLQGAWLKRAGFAIGVKVTVQVSAGRLVIESAEPEIDVASRFLKRRVRSD
jgi:type I toxin-antitoxin system toxin SymE